MFSLFFCAFSANPTTPTDYLRNIENDFNLIRCTSYILGQPLFQLEGAPQERRQDELTLYLPKYCWGNETYSWKIPEENNLPTNEGLFCTVITNGSAGKKLVFDALRSNIFDDWCTVMNADLNQVNLQCDSFEGCAHKDGATLVLTGLYKELSTNPLIGEKFTVCGEGAPYIQEKERTAQDREAVQHWQRQMGKGNIVVLYHTENAHA